MTNHGGKRSGAGRKSNWNTTSTGTTLIRVPTVLAEALMVARNNHVDIDLLASGILGTHELVTQSKPEPREQPVNYWQGEKQCQSVTTTGRRCKKRGVSVIKYGDGEYLACDQHYDNGFKPIDV